MEVAVGTDLGIWQRRQSDAYIAENIGPNVSLLAVADGFGEVGRGNATAGLALTTVRDYLRRRQRVGSFGRGLSPGALRSILLAALDHANARLFAQSGSHEDFVGSGTSVTAILVVGGHAFVGHVGDARAYLMRLDSLELLTADDAMFADTPLGGSKTALTAKPRTRGLLWRSLGTQPKLEASIAHVELMPGDQVVLCTDGIHRTIDDDELAATLLGCDRASDVVARLLAAAKARGAVDNSTLVVGRDLMATAPPVALAAGQQPLRAVLALFMMIVTLFATFGLFSIHFGH